MTFTEIRNDRHAYEYEQAYEEWQAAMRYHDEQEKGNE